MLLKRFRVGVLAISASLWRLFERGLIHGVSVDSGVVGVDGGDGGDEVVALENDTLLAITRVPGILRIWW